MTEQFAVTKELGIPVQNKAIAAYGSESGGIPCLREDCTIST